MTRPPAKPSSVRTRDSTPASQGVKGVIHDTPAPRSVALTIPPRKPSQVLPDLDRIDAIQDAAVPLDQSPVVLDSAIALDGRHDQATGEAQQREDQGQHAGLPGREGRDP